jgi:hypothetical protein
MQLLEGKDVIVGVIDVASDVVETPEQVADTIGRALQFVPRHRLIACTNYGMAPMSREVTMKKLRALAEGRRLLDSATAAHAEPALPVGRPPASRLARLADAVAVPQARAIRRSRVRIANEFERAFAVSSAKSVCASTATRPARRPLEEPPCPPPP